MRLREVGSREVRDRVRLGTGVRLRGGRGHVRVLEYGWARALALVVVFSDLVLRPWTMGGREVALAEW